MNQRDVVDLDIYDAIPLLIADLRDLSPHAFARHRVQQHRRLLAARGNFRARLDPCPAVGQLSAQKIELINAVGAADQIPLDFQPQPITPVAPTHPEPGCHHCHHQNGAGDHDPFAKSELHPLPS